MTDPFSHALDQSVVEQFDCDGYVVTPEVLTDTELARYSRALDLEVARRTQTDNREVATKSTYEQSFIQCMRLWETSVDVLPLTCHTGLASVAAQLLQVPSVRLWQDQALYKEPGGRETTPHQDQTFWPIGVQGLLTAWIPLDDVSIASGAMAYVPGSHKAGRLKVVDITHTTEPYDILSDDALQGRAPKPVEVSAGSVIWHHGLTVHQASANTTSAMRRVFTIVYIDAAAQRTQAWPAYPLDRDGVEVGAVIAGPGMPILWPPPAILPKPPTQISVLVGPQTTDQS
mgnify:FL=1